MDIFVCMTLGEISPYTQLYVARGYDRIHELYVQTGNKAFLYIRPQQNPKFCALSIRKYCMYTV